MSVQTFLINKTHYQSCLMNSWTGNNQVEFNFLTTSYHFFIFSDAIISLSNSFLLLNEQLLCLSRTWRMVLRAFIEQ